MRIPTKIESLPAYDDQPSRWVAAYLTRTATGETDEDGNEIIAESGPVVVVFSNTATALAREYRISEDGTNKTGSEILADFGVEESPEPERPPQVPQSISARGARLALNEAGLRDGVEDTVAAANRDTQDYWLYSQTIGRQHPVLLGMQQQLGLSDEQVNALFVRAVGLDL